MRLKSPKIIYLLFFLSGLAGLVYEIVWGRMLILIFGNTTSSQVATISAFLLGLALGSLIFGKISDGLSARKLIKAYWILELAIGLSAISTLILIPTIRSFYSLFSDGSSTSPSLLLIKFAASMLLILIPTSLMGATLPTLARFLKSQNNSLSLSVSYLYSVNTFGACLGTVLCAFILIELFGLRNTLLLAAALNIIISQVARSLKVKNEKIERLKLTSSFTSFISPQTLLTVLAFSISGLVSIAYEILFTRILIPTFGTYIYAFSSVLAIYLFGIAAGSLIFGSFIKIFKYKNHLAFAACQLGIGIAVQMFILLNITQLLISKTLIIILALLPASIFMGLTFPVVIAIIDKKQNEGKAVGLSYFGNTTGSIAGGFLANFFLIPTFGSFKSIALLSLFNFAIAIFFVFKEQKIKTVAKVSTILAILPVFIFLISLQKGPFYPKIIKQGINWAREKNIDFVYKEDEVAAVLAYSDKKNNDQNLYIDGFPTTDKVGETKLMAHIPILLHNDPKNALVIAFGMGTTYRSSLAWNIQTDVVELVPSIPPLMKLFYDDAQDVLKNQKGKIVINDGRNYIFLTGKKYDIVTIDPPPPFNAAGTTVLYSTNFYQEIAKKLNPGGIVSQWIWFGTRKDDVAMAIKSFVNVFPYVLVFQSPRQNGIFLEGSLAPFTQNKQVAEQKLKNAKAISDLQEAYDNSKLDQVLNLLFTDRASLLNWLKDIPEITDDHPRTEYFLLRHFFTKSPDLANQKIDLKSFFSSVN